MTSPWRTNVKRYRKSGAVAQLGERVVRNDEVGGSNPPSSTSFSSDPIDLPLKDCPGAVRKGQ